MLPIIYSRNVLFISEITDITAAGLMICISNKRRLNRWYNIYMLYSAYYHSLYVPNVYILVPLEIDQSVDMNHDLTQNLASENLDFQNSG